MRCPRGMSTIRYTRFSYKKILMGKKKIVVLCLDVIMIASLPEKYTVKFSSWTKRARKYRASALWASQITP